VLLTYAQCTLDMNTVKFHLGLKPDIKYMIICRELHKNGDPHFHAMITFSKKVDIRNPRHFDIEGFHPKLEAVKHVAKTKNYLKKDGDYVEVGDEENEKKGDELPIWEDGMTKREWLIACFERKVPYGYCLALWDEYNPSNSWNTLLEFDEGHASRITHGKLVCLVPTLDHLKSYLIVGPSGCGKTTWCKLHSLKPALMVTHMDDLKQFKIDYHKSIIFDDMTFTHLDPVLQIPIVDRYDNRSLHCRYACAAIPAGIQKFFTCNVIPFDISKPQILRRVNLINLF